MTNEKTTKKIPAIINPLNMLSLKFKSHGESFKIYSYTEGYDKDENVDLIEVIVRLPKNVYATVYLYNNFDKISISISLADLDGMEKSILVSSKERYSVTEALTFIDYNNQVTGEQLYDTITYLINFLLKCDSSKLIEEENEFNIIFYDELLQDQIRKELKEVFSTDVHLSLTFSLGDKQ